MSRGRHDRGDVAPTKRAHLGAMGVDTRRSSPDLHSGDRIERGNRHPPLRAIAATAPPPAARIVAVEDGHLLTGCELQLRSVVWGDDHRTTGAGGEVTGGDPALTRLAGHENERRPLSVTLANSDLVIGFESYRLPRRNLMAR